MTTTFNKLNYLLGKSQLFFDNNENKFLSNFTKAVEFSDRVQEAKLEYGPFPSYKKGDVNSNSFAHSLTKELGYKAPKQNSAIFNLDVEDNSATILLPGQKLPIIKTRYEIPGSNLKTLEKFRYKKPTPYKTKPSNIFPVSRYKN